MSVTVVPGLTYAYDSAAHLWVAPGWQSLPATAAVIDRASLVPGTYIPGTAADLALGIAGIQVDTVGVANDALITNVVEQSTTLQITNSTPASYFENTHFRCSLFISSALSTNKTFRNCRFSGTNPDALFASASGATAALPQSASGCVTNWSNRHITFIDCEFDHTWWQRNGLASLAGWQSTTGFYGGHITLTRCLVTGFTDGINQTGAPGNAAGDQYWLIEQSRLGPNFFMSEIPMSFGPQGGQFTHSDGFQFNTGPNVEIRYSYVGGPKLASADTRFPNGGTQQRDCGNAGFMIQQEPDSRYDDTRKRIDNVYIHHNWVAGGAAAINLNYAQNNTLPAPGLVAGRAGTRVEENRVMNRIPGFNDGPGYQIRYRTEMQASVAGNVQWDPFGSIDGTGAPVIVNEVSNSGAGDVTVATWPSPAL